MNKVFVTGGSGYIGRHLIADLVARGDSVVALARSVAAQNIVEALGAEAARGDLDDRDALDRAMRGCTHVVHSAAAMSGAREVMHRVNVGGTEAMLGAARAAGTVRRFLFLGAAASLVGRREVHHADETWPLQRLSYFPYAATKAIADDAVRAASTEGFDAFVVRPGWVWGRGDAHISSMLGAARAGKMMWIGRAEHHLVTSHLENTCHGALLALDRARGGEAYFVFDDDEISSREWITRLLAAHGVAPPTRTIPYRVAWTIATVMDGVSRVTGKPLPISRAFVRLTAHEFTVKDDKARRDLGYHAVISREEGLAELSRASTAESAQKKESREVAA